MLLTALLLATTATAAPLEPRIPPGVSRVSIHPKGHLDKCLDVSGGVHNMNAVVIASCNSSPSQNWNVWTTAATYIQSAADETLCLDAGTNPLAGYHPSNGAYAKLMLCPSPNWPSPYDSPAGTKWLYNGAQFPQKGTNFCLDNADGKFTDGNKVQIWDCHDTCHPDYKNQAWEFTYH